MTDLQASPMVARVGTMPKNGQKRYDDGERTWQSMTVLLKNLETDTFGLDEWKQNMLAIGLSMRSDLVLGVSAAAQFDPQTGKLTKDAKDALRKLRGQATDAAKGKAGQNQGTAIHTATERLDLGETLESIGLPYPFNADLRAYDVLKRAMGLQFRPEHVERTVRVTELDVCGSFDRIGTCALLEKQGVLRPGELIIVDVKTEERPLLNLMHIVPQQAGYSRGDGMWNPRTQSYEPMPPVSRGVALIIHVRNGEAVPYLLNLEPGWRSALRAAQQRDDMKASKLELGESGCWAMPVDVKLPAATDLVARQFQAEQEARAAQQTTGEVAVQRADGMYDFQPSPAVSVHSEMQEFRSEMQQFAIDAIGNAVDLSALSVLFTQITASGVAWDGDVARAGEIRGRIVQCPQRALHTRGRCACGWRQGLQP